MDSILSKQHYRRTFFVVVGLIFLLALAARFFVVPFFDYCQRIGGWELAALLLDNLVVSLLVAVFIGGFVFWLTPEIVKKSSIEVIEPKQINPSLKGAATTTKSWVYKGACGRFTRSATLPALAAAAKVEGIGRDLTICILNPRNTSLCSEYAIYRRSLKSAETSTKWTTESVQEEVLATAVTVLKYQFSEPLLRIRLFFVDHFSAFRLDIADQFVVITKEDKEASALRAEAGTYFYDSYKDDVRLTERQSIEMKCCGKLTFETAQVDEVLLREAVKCAGLFDEAALERLDIKRILECINNPKNPY